jgi:hypothetical protein
MSLRALADIFEGTRLASDEDSPFPAHVTLADSRVIVMTGANATGKSVAFKCLAGLVHQAKLAPITLSIRERTGSGTYDMAGLRRSMLYGEEHEQSTGACSMSTAIRGFANVRSRLEQAPPTPTVLMFDEPEMGLSEGYSRAMGRYLAEQVQTLPPDAPGLIVVSHSRPLVQALVDTLASDPIHIHMGPQPLSLADWLVTPEDRTVDELLALVEEGRAGRRKLSDWLKPQS